MRIFTSKNVVQKIVILLLVVLLFNFLVPIKVFADDDDDVPGGSLLRTLMHLFQGLGDIINGAFNHFMLGTTQILGSSMLDYNDPDYRINIENEGSALFYGEPDSNATVITIEPGYLFEANGWLFGDTIQVPNILYCPENIFANKIAVLDINFLNPNKYEAVEYGEDGETEGAYSVEHEASISLTQRGGEKNNLRNIISSWYKAFRNIAVVGLLIVLVYIGIRTLISSTSSDKAKYKESLQDWLVALCLIFFIHYIMAGILMVTEKFTELVDKSVDTNVYVDASKAEENDMLIDDGLDGLKFKTTITGYVRFMAQSDDPGDCAAFTIMYVALVIFTIMFTITYIKRFLYVAFFTMIAPLVALSYPLDKLRDGKAQAFNIWFKEYTMNVIIQPVHLLLFSIFIGSAMDLATNNPIYAVVAMGFLLPAEKFIKKLFGLDRAETAKGLGEIAGGALAMQGMGKLIGQFTGGSKNKGNTSNKTAETNALNKPRGANPEFQSQSYSQAFGANQQRQLGNGAGQNGNTGNGNSNTNELRYGQRIERRRNERQDGTQEGGILVNGSQELPQNNSGDIPTLDAGSYQGESNYETGQYSMDYNRFAMAPNEIPNPNELNNGQFSPTESNTTANNGSRGNYINDSALDTSALNANLNTGEDLGIESNSSSGGNPTTGDNPSTGGNPTTGDNPSTGDNQNNSSNVGNRHALNLSVGRNPSTMDKLKDWATPRARGIQSVASNRAAKITGAITKPFTKENRGNTFKAVAKGAGRLAGAAVVGTAASTLGIAAGVASGDAGKAFSYGSAAFAQGAHLGGMAGAKAGETVSSAMVEDKGVYETQVKDKETRKRERQERYDREWKKNSSNIQYLREQGYTDKEARERLDSGIYDKFLNAGVTDISIAERAMKRANANNLSEEHMVKVAQMAQNSKENFGTEKRNAIRDDMVKQGIHEDMANSVVKDMQYVLDVED